MVDVVSERLSNAMSLGAEAAIDAPSGVVAGRIRGLTGGEAQVSLEALGMAETANASIECLRPLERYVQVGQPVWHTAVQTINMNAVYMGKLALCGSRGMPSWRYPALLSLIERGRVEVPPIVVREVALSRASAELQAFDGAMPPGVAVITDFTGLALTIQKQF